MSPEGSAIASSTPVPPPIIALNVTPGSGAGQSSTGMQKKQPRKIPTANLPDARKLFNETPEPTPATDPAYYDEFMEIIYESMSRF